ncbi:putative immunoglobulin-blocking virulence protein [Mycoplasma sp. 1654_15]|uniref:putative immunoglobulin-blocking virulence protein n=1 Tax=Mycoplasma sp. 1654_15 TaxID=2725994 RepID=UPI00144A247E|nr:putative immunoglobulin-blocking virulence protein [Mycoplasma sp. 1654_15]QJB71551.1 putative immunoglobulin-blocking virulence protein [Mycoplasma sp. 1654_15]
MSILKKTTQLLRKSKNKKILISFATVLSIPSVVGIAYYATSKGTDSNLDLKILDQLNANNVTLQTIENADTNKAFDALNDKNLKPEKLEPKPEKPEPPVIVDPPEDPPKILDPEPEPQKPDIQQEIIKEQPQPTPSTPDPEPPVEKPVPSIKQNFKNDEVGVVTLKWEGHNVTARVRKRPNRQYTAYDQQNGLANRIPYHSQVVDEVLSIEVTPELREQNLKNATTALNASVKGIFNIDKNDIKNDATIAGILHSANNAYQYKNLFWKFEALFENGDKVREFLTQEGQTLYPWIKKKYEDDLFKADQAIAQAQREMEALQRRRPPRIGFDGNGKETFTPENQIQMNEWLKEFAEQTDKQKAAEQLKTDAKNVKYIKLIYYLDYSKFNKNSRENDEYLARGLTINPDNSNISIDKDGTLKSNSWSPLLNQVTSVYQKDNETRRAFGYDSYWWRPGGSILEGNYPGWTKKDITDSPEFQKYNVSKSDGINIAELTKNSDNKAKSARDHGIVVTIDFSNPKGYEKTKKLIEELKADNKEITSYRFFHIGKDDANQKFKDILQILPENLPQLELLFDSTNTSPLLALENKKIDELSIYTEGNSLSDDWAINPWALKNTAWYNSNDYNVSFDYPKGAKVATRVTFNSLAFDDSDYKGGHSPSDYKRINDGLRIAYWTRNNEKVFQGGFGPGLRPDENESENSYPTGLDLTRVTKMKSLRGLQFSDTQKASNSKPRRLTRIGLYNDSQTFSIDVDELNNAQFNVLDTNPMSQPKPKIFFSNGNTTKRIEVTASGNITLNARGAQNLRILLENGRQKNDDTKLFTDQRIIVDKSQTALANSLRSNGFQVDESNISGINFQ